MDPSFSGGDPVNHRRWRDPLQPQKTARPGPLWREFRAYQPQPWSRQGL